MTVELGIFIALFIYYRACLIILALSRYKVDSRQNSTFNIHMQNDYMSAVPK